MSHNLHNYTEEVMKDFENKFIYQAYGIVKGGRKTMSIRRQDEYIPLSSKNVRDFIFSALSTQLERVREFTKGGKIKGYTGIERVDKEFKIHNEALDMVLDFLTPEGELKSNHTSAGGKGTHLDSPGSVGSIKDK